MTADSPNPEQQFYLAVAEILECEVDYQPWPYSRKTRWNNRQPGNGRFPGRGLVRRYSSTMIHVNLVNPPIVGRYTQEDQALQAISLAITNKDT